MKVKANGEGRLHFFFKNKRRSEEKSIASHDIYAKKTDTPREVGKGEGCRAEKALHI